MEPIRNESLHDSHILLLEDFDSRARMQVRRKRYQDRLRTNLEDGVSMAALDELSKLHNRRYLTTYLNREFERALQTGKPLSLIILDVDHFKKVNDTHGHAVGDVVWSSWASG